MEKDFYICNSCGTIVEWDELLYHQYCPHCGSGRIEETTVTALTGKELYLKRIGKVIRKTNGEEL